MAGPDARHRRRDVGADGHRPEGQLIPRKQVAGEGEEQRQQEHHDADHPVPLTPLALADAVLVGAGQEHSRQVQDHGDDHQVGTDAVHRAEPPAERHHVLDVLHRLVRPLDRRHVEEHEGQAGQDEQEEQGTRRRCRASPSSPRRARACTPWPGTSGAAGSRQWRRLPPGRIADGSSRVSGCAPRVPTRLWACGVNWRRS